MGDSLDSSMRPDTWFMIYQPDEVLDSSLNSWVRRVTWFMIYQPDEVLDGGFVGQLSETSHTVYDEL